VVELRNTTNQVRTLRIEPTAHQRLGAATTFTGRLGPGETKVLYLYDGFVYRFRLAGASGDGGEVSQDIRVASDVELAYGGDSLTAARTPRIEVGEPVLVGAESYEGLSEPQLDRAFRELDVLMSPAARSEYAALTVDGKRAFLLRFWAARDPTPGTPKNEFRDEVDARLAAIRSRFSTGGEPGIETARGRIYLEYGKPDRVVARTLTSWLANPYEVWQYFSTGYSYVFLDELRTGRFVLLTSTDPSEPGKPNWRERIPDEAAEELLGR
jgi:GWxTD domain-containing protein